MTLLLHRVQIEEATREQKLAFFINLYNALVIHANVVRGPPTNLWQRYKVRKASLLATRRKFQKSQQVTAYLFIIYMYNSTGTCKGIEDDRL